LSSDLKFLICKDESNNIKKLIPLNDIINIKIGRQTENFKRFSSDYDNRNRSFSLMLKERTFDLEGKNKDEVNQFIKTLDNILKKNCID
jgi:hypothetical protein